MSKVNLESAQTNIERLATNLNELNQILSSKKEEIDTKVREFKEGLSSFFKEAEEINLTISSEDEKKNHNNRNLDQLTEQRQELTHSKDVLVSEIGSKQRDIEQLTSLILEKEKTNTEVSLQVDSLTERVANAKRKIEEYNVLLESLKEENKEKIRARDIKIAEINSEYNRMTSRSKALKYLIRKDIVALPEIQVIRSLKTPGVDSVENLKKTSGVSDEIIMKILQDLDRREIIALNPSTGRFQVLSEIDI